ncbi:hypothetical protein [Halorussus litoreus]|uniref:hypothetical protein n=1 Tax=Halorussus litoreus TaxID=1710536 RepID=UPI000E2774E4|nr:hypothetical protein [Halorussus litoreus]
MARFDSVGALLRVAAVFVVYSVAVQASQAIIDSLYLGGVVALLVTLVAVLALDAVPALVRGQTPSFGEGSYFYAGRGLLTLVGFLLVTAVFVDWLRTSAAFPEWLAVLVGALGAAVLVFGGLVAYYWRRASGTASAG